MPRSVAIVRGGIVSLATAYKLLLGKRYDDVVVLEKEHDVGLSEPQSMGCRPMEGGGTII